jgi:hypothetical protein
MKVDEKEVKRRESPCNSDGRRVERVNAEQ